MLLYFIKTITYFTVTLYILYIVIAQIHFKAFLKITIVSILQFFMEYT